MHYKTVFLLAAFLIPHKGMAQPPQKSGTSPVATYEIQTGDPAPISSPFFADTAPSEIMEKFEELEGRIETLEAKAIQKEDGTVQLKTKEGAVIQLNGENILIKAPGKVLIEAKEIKAPAMKR